MKNKPDDRSDNVKEIQKHIEGTIDNMELAQDMIAVTDDDKTKKDLKEKNGRRAQALDSMRSEIKDEVSHQKRQ